MIFFYSQSPLSLYVEVFLIEKNMDVIVLCALLICI